MPAEWAPHAACWLAWPCGETLWGAALGPVEKSFAALCRSIANVDGHAGAAAGERLHVLVRDASGETAARAALGGTPARFHVMPYGDIWLRDTAPVFIVRGDGAVASVRFGFNGWGGKYLFEDDLGVAARIATLAGVRAFAFPWILEGGAIEVDGEGTCLTTRQCLLNPNRNPGLDQAAIERGLRNALGVERILWLDRGLVNDHTDGHVDTLARFVAPGVVVCMEAATADDPNAAVLDAIARDLGRFTDARGRRLEVVRIPAPGRIVETGEIVPASYANFYVANGTVSVPTYDVPEDERAVAGIAACFPGRRTIAIPARALVASGGGAFHCITQQVPAGRDTELGHG
jgi:agmatine deiminase